MYGMVRRQTPLHAYLSIETCQTKEISSQTVLSHTSASCILWHSKGQHIQDVCSKLGTVLGAVLLISEHTDCALGQIIVHITSVISASCCHHHYNVMHHHDHPRYYPYQLQRHCENLQSASCCHHHNHLYQVQLHCGVF